MYTLIPFPSNMDTCQFMTAFSITVTVLAVTLIITILCMDEPKKIIEEPMNQESQENTVIHVLSRKGHPLTPKQVESRSKQIGFDICFYNRILAVYNMKFVADTCKKILDSPEEKMKLSLEQIQRVRSDLKYANTKITKYITKSRNHPHIVILEALANKETFIA